MYMQSWMPRLETGTLDFKSMQHRVSYSNVTLCSISSTMCDVLCFLFRVVIVRSLGEGERMGEEGT